MSSSRIAKNTAALFARQLVVVAINLYTVRVLLDVLGLDDFALYNVVLNVVLLASFLTAALTMIVQRYFSFVIGKTDVDQGTEALNRVYDTSLIFCALAIVMAVIGLEIAGIWFISNHLVVAEIRQSAVGILFQLLILYFVANTLVSFYSAIVLAREDMHVFAVVSVTNAVLRLAAAAFTGVLGPDRIITYGALFCASAVLTFALYYIWCVRKYQECRPRAPKLEVASLMDMLSFSGWTIFGQVTTVCRSQAVTILINQSFNPATVAARALAVSVAAQVLTFSNNFTMALHPPIIKAHAAAQSERLFELIFTGSKITFFLVWIATLPLVALMPGVLSIWLGDFPEDTVIFTRLALIENAIMAISFPLMTAVRATGRVRTYELALGSLQVLVLLLSYVSIKLGYSAVSVYVVAIVVNLIMFVVRLIIVRGLTQLSILSYAKIVLVPVVLVVGTTSVMTAAILKLTAGYPHSSAVPIIAVLAILGLPVVVIVALGLSAADRQTLFGMIQRKFFKRKVAQ